MKMTEELQKLGQLHKEGSLSDSEFTLAKQKLLSEKYAPESTLSRNDDYTGKAVRTYVTWQIASSIIGGIIFLYVFFNYFVPQMPGHNQPTIQFVTPSK